MTSFAIWDIGYYIVFFIYILHTHTHMHFICYTSRLAALEGHYDAVRTLLFHNADVNAKDADGRSTLYILALENRLTMAKFLLERANAGVESRDSEVSNNQL